MRAPAPPRGRQLWEVVGGRDRGGIVVRSGQDVSSPQLERLATGALVAQVELLGDRLHYELVRGAGPPRGWVSLRLKDGKDLVVQAGLSATLDEVAPPAGGPGPPPASAPPSRATAEDGPPLPSPRAAPLLGRRPRVLALHGPASNQNVMKFQTSGLRAATRRDVDWVFAEGPLPWAPVEGSSFPSEQPRSEGELRIAKGRDFVQWYRTAAHGADGASDVWEGVGQCTEALQRVIDQEAPIDVIVAFSQGSSAVSLLIEQLRRRRAEPSWRLNIFFCGGNIDDDAYQFTGECPVPTVYVSGGEQDQFDAWIRGKVEGMYSCLRSLRHEDGHAFPMSMPRASEVYASVAEEIRRHCPSEASPLAAPPRGVVPAAATVAATAPAAAPAAAAAAAAGDEELPAGLWTVDYIGNARGPCKRCKKCDYYRWNPNKLRPDMGDDGEATITEWFLNDYGSLNCHFCGCAFSDHRSLGPVNKPAGFYPGLSEEDANALLGR